MMGFLRLDDLPIDVTSDDVIAAFRPFVAENAGAGARRKAIAQLRYKSVKRALLRLAGGSIRDSGVVHAEYEEAWLKGYVKYSIAAGPRKPEPWDYRGRPLMADRAGVPRLRSVILGGVIRTLKPKRILEVGCGNGINLLLLAGAFPEIEFTGLELTEAGHRTALEAQKGQALPLDLASFAPLPQKDPQAFRRIKFLRGDATAMPFADGAFDLVITVLAVEQMERVRDRALAEIARVSGGHVLNLEPFADVNPAGWKGLNAFGRDYFRGRISDLPRYGLTPLWATKDFPQEIILGAALVLSRKALPAG